MTDPNDLPPVGATVTDADGSTCTYHVSNTLGKGRWAIGSYYVHDAVAQSALTALWRMQQRAEQAEAWKREALAVTPDWHAIGVALGVPLGQSVPAHVLPGILRLQAEVARLREAISLCSGPCTTIARDGIEPSPDATAPEDAGAREPVPETPGGEQSHSPDGRARDGQEGA